MTTPDEWPELTLRALKPSQPFVQEREGSRLAWRRSDLAASALRELVDKAMEARPPISREHMTLSSEEDLWLLHGGKKSDVLGVRLASGRPFALKFIHDRRIVAAIRTAAGRGKGRRAFERGWGLEVRGAPAPRVHAYVEERPFGPCILVMELLEGLEKLQSVVSRDAPDRRLAEVLGEGVALLHAKGIVHGDLSSRNLLISPGKWEEGFRIVDFEDVRFLDGFLPVDDSAAQLKDLDRSLPDVPWPLKLRFLRKYIRKRGWPVTAAAFARRWFS